MSAVNGTLEAEIHYVDMLRGKDGESAFQLAVDQGYTGTLDEWLASLKGADGKDGATGAQGIQGEKGDKGDTGETGQAGYSPSAYVSKEGTTATLTVVDETGKTQVEILDGAKGDKGDKGDKGEQGLQGAQGVQGIQGEKGEKGDKGDKGDTGATGAQGEKGADGYTPVKGTDYFTEADKAEMVSAVRNADVWELVYEKTLEAEIATMEMSTYADGTPLSLKKMILLVTIPAGKSLTLRTNTYFYTLNQSDLSVSFQGIGGAGSTTNETISGIYYDGLFFGRYPAVTSGSLSAPNSAKTPSYTIANATITKTIASIPTGETFPAGTNIRLYGIRA